MDLSLIVPQGDSVQQIVSFSLQFMLTKIRILLGQCQVKFNTFTNRGFWELPKEQSESLLIDSIEIQKIIGSIQRTLKTRNS